MVSSTSVTSPYRGDRFLQARTDAPLEAENPNVLIGESNAEAVGGRILQYLILQIQIFFVREQQPAMSLVVILMPDA